MSPPAAPYGTKLHGSVEAPLADADAACTHWWMRTGTFQALCLTASCIEPGGLLAAVEALSFPAGHD